MKTASLADVKAKFGDYLKESVRSPVVVTQNGKAVAAIISLANEEDLERLMLSYSPKLRAILSAAKHRLRNGKGMTQDKFWQEVSSKSRPSPKRKAS